MKIILSPAKNLNEHVRENHDSSIPIFEKEANQLIMLKKIKMAGKLN